MATDPRFLHDNNAPLLPNGRRQFTNFNEHRMADTLPPDQCVYNGVQYPSMYAACVAASVSYDRVRRRMSENARAGMPVWTLQQAIDAPKYARAPMSAADGQLEAIVQVYRATSKGDEHAAIVKIARLCADYLRMIPHVQG